MDNLQIETDGESGGVCECCGSEMRMVWGFAHAPDKGVAAYFVQWTCNKPEYSPNFDLLIGTWGDESSNDKKLSSWILNTEPGSGGFMAVDSAERPIASSELCNEALAREQVINNPDLMEWTTSIIDAIWLGDPRIEEIKNWINPDA